MTGPWRAVWLCALAACTAPTLLSAQMVSFGPQFILSEYRETSRALRFRGTGYGGALSLAYGRVGAEVAYATMSFDPGDDGGAVESFDAAQLDVRIRYDIAGPVSAEAGLTNRAVRPHFTAQEVAAARIGVRLSQLVDPAVRLSLRGNYLAAARFSGGGSAPLGFELGLGVSGAFVQRHLRLSAEYEFQYFGRATNDGSGDVSVPIQQSLLRVGVAGQF